MNKTKQKAFERVKEGKASKAEIKILIAWAEDEIIEWTLFLEDCNKRIENTQIIKSKSKNNMTPFKDLPEGQTHYYNDGCGEPAHNQPTQTWQEEYCKEFGLCKEGEKCQCKAELKFISSQKELSYQEGAKSVKEKVKNQLVNNTSKTF